MCVHVYEYEHVCSLLYKSAGCSSALKWSGLSMLSFVMCGYVLDNSVDKPN